MELFIIIAIIALAAAYLGRNFYRKFLAGNTQNNSCGCSGCGCTPQDGCDPNTIGSKSIDAQVSQASIEMKVLIEQMREQVQNIE